MAVDLGKVKERVTEWGSLLRDRLADVLDDFKRQTRFFKMRVGVITSFVVLTLATLLIAPAPGIDNPIDAHVQATSLPWGMRNKTIIEVRNNSGDDYEKLIVIIEGSGAEIENGPSVTGRWRYTKSSLGEGQSLQIESKNLANEKGQHPAVDFSPTRVEVQCSDGIYSDVLTLRTIR